MTMRLFVIVVSRVSHLILIKTGLFKMSISKVLRVDNNKVISVVLNR